MTKFYPYNGDLGSWVGEGVCLNLHETEIEEKYGIIVFPQDVN